MTGLWQAFGKGGDAGKPAAHPRERTNAMASPTAAPIPARNKIQNRIGSPWKWMSVQEVLGFGREGSSVGAAGGACGETAGLPRRDGDAPPARVPEPFRDGADDVSMRGRPSTPERSELSSPTRPESGSDPEPGPLPISPEEPIGPDSLPGPLRTTGPGCRRGPGVAGPSPDGRRGDRRGGSIRPERCGAGVEPSQTPKASATSCAVWGRASGCFSIIRK